jgi:4-hydroxybenzoate polyprenyltransferase
MIFARSFAMGANRLLDWQIDRLNPRTIGRMIPSGLLTPREGLTWTLLAACFFIFSASKLGSMALYCAPPLLIFLGLYSVLKRFTWATHFYLGICLGLSPLAVEVSIAQEWTTPILLLGCGIALWTAGFDILYSLQDVEFDRSHNLQSFPGRFGPRVSFLATCSLFLASVLCWIGVGLLQHFGLFYFVGVGLVSAILSAEIWLIRGLWKIGKSDRLGQAFFTVNGWVSVIFLAFVALERIQNG